MRWLRLADAEADATCRGALARGARGGGGGAGQGGGVLEEEGFADGRCVGVHSTPRARQAHAAVVEVMVGGCLRIGDSEWGFTRYVPDTVFATQVS